MKYTTTKFNRYKSQTATEYLIILAVVIVIALVVVNTMGGFPGIGSTSAKKVTDFKLAQDTIGIEYYSIGTDSSLFKLKNNYYDTITVTSFKVNNQSNLTCNSSNTNPVLPIVLNIGDSKLINCSIVNSSTYTLSSKQTPVVGISYIDSLGVIRTAGNEGSVATTSNSGGENQNQGSGSSSIRYIDMTSHEGLYGSEVWEGVPNENLDNYYQYRPATGENFTVASWIYIPSGSSDSFQIFSAEWAFAFAYDGESEKLGVFSWWPGWIDRPASISKDVWVHVALVGTIGEEEGSQIYVNGQPEGLSFTIPESDIRTRNDYPDDGSVRLLSYSSSSPLNGRGTDMRLYTRRLSSQEIQTMASLGDVSSSNLIFRFIPQSDTTTILNDDSAENSNLILTISSGYLRSAWLPFVFGDVELPRIS